MPHRLAVYPGTFDPVSNGHLDVIRRGAAMFEELVVACAHNIAKTPLFSTEERMDMLRQVTSDLPNVRIDGFDGMVVDYVKENKGKVILRGLRTFSDFESEVQMAYANRTFDPNIETVFVCASIEESFISSRLIREAAAMGAEITRFVPPIVAEKLREKRDILRGSMQDKAKGR
ncbi:pantetheine-phosphate adenylyltransferase [Planctomycetota bacterium]|nr:pantetheine-phosphate adenylyltransferase [Planctomycetota bacterium]